MKTDRVGRKELVTFRRALTGGRHFQKFRREIFVFYLQRSARLSQFERRDKWTCRAVN